MKEGASSWDIEDGRQAEFPGSLGLNNSSEHRHTFTKELKKSGEKHLDFYTFSVYNISRFIALILCIIA